MKINKLIDFGPWCFLVSSLAFIATIPLPSFKVTYGVVGIIATILIIPGTFALKEFFENYDNGKLPLFASIFMLTGGIFINSLYLISTIDSKNLVDPMNNTLISYSISLGNIFFVGIFLFIISAFRRNIMKKWINWIGISGSILVIPWFGFPFVPLLLKGIGSIGFLLTLFWMVMISIKMIQVKSK